MSTIEENAKLQGYSNDFQYLTEAFVSIQGEGVHQGQNALFIRLQGCNSRCKFCDSKETWAETNPGINVTKYDIAKEMHNAIQLFIEQGYKFKNIIITGGEPLLHDSALAEFFRGFPVKKISDPKQSKCAYTLDSFTYVFETNGSLIPKETLCIINQLMIKHFIARDAVQFSISPKFFSDQVDAKSEIVAKSSALITHLTAYGRIKFITKFVVDIEKYDEEIDLIETYCDVHDITPEMIYIQPLGTKVGEIKIERDVMDKIVLAGYHISPRLHIMYKLK